MALIDQEFKENLLAAIWESEAAEEQMIAKMQTAHADLGPTKIPAKKRWRPIKKKHRPRWTLP
jgi:hypothetical protein